MQKQIFKCNVCGNIVEVLHAGVGQLVCCGQPMELLTEKTEDVGLEKHAPVIESREQGEGQGWECSAPYGTEALYRVD